MPATLSFWGAVGTVTGSKHLLETDRARVLVDCGIFQGLKELREKNWEDPPFSPSTIDAVVLTHAHTDHIGYLPRIVKLGFRGPIYCSRATAMLAEIVLMDSAKLMLEEANWRNEQGLTMHAPAEPLFTEEDVKRTVKLFRPQRPDAESFGVVDGIYARWRPTGHLLGARQILLEVDNAGTHGERRSILFSGDLGRRAQPVLPDPAEPFECDYLLIESTYGDRRHPEADPRDELREVILDAHANNRTVLIPAFAMGRTQDLLYDIRELEDDGKVPVLPVRADSPMGAAATEAYFRAIEEHDEETVALTAKKRNPFRTKSMLFTTKQSDSMKLNDERGARILIASSGMMTGGRVLHHARRILPNPEAVMCFVGYQAEGTIGRRILDGEKEVRIYKQWVPVRCKVVKIEGFSAHADYAEILDWLEPLRSAVPRRTFIVHGEPTASLAMEAHIKERFGSHWTTHIPTYGEKFVLA